ncbi:MAG: hypothetical protein ACRD3M_06265 [Thermoanaerobaculia bacterium]
MPRGRAFLDQLEQLGDESRLFVTSRERRGWLERWHRDDRPASPSV